MLISTAIPNIVTVANSSCPQGATSSCASNRGEVFAPNSSTTWQFRNVFGLYPELNYTSAEEPAYYGLDTVGLGLSSSGTTLKDQVVAAVESTDYDFGYLGIDPQPTNWTLNFTVESESFFKTLETDKLIPSLTYSYTAGAQYRFKGVLGSMVFGGYDASRVATRKDNDVVFTMADDVSRDLVVAIQSITTDTSHGTTSLLPDDSVLAFIDSTFPYFVLPYSACRAFESAFGLQWDPQAGSGGLYTLSSTQHANLKQLNPSISFTLANDLEGGPTTTITLPYAAFDLQASPPLVNSTTSYFPLLRSANDTQITLGRAFLQEAMLAVDYGSSNFSVWPCVWNSNAAQNIVALTSEDSSSNAGSSSAGSSANPNSSSNLTPLGVGLGIGLGVPLLTILILLAIARRQRRWPFGPRHPVPSHAASTYPSQPGSSYPASGITSGTALSGPELEAESSSAFSTMYTNTSFANSRSPPDMYKKHIHEADGSLNSAVPVYEKYADGLTHAQPELEGSQTAREMDTPFSPLSPYGGSQAPTELDADVPRASFSRLELPANPVSSSYFQSARSPRTPQSPQSP